MKTWKKTENGNEFVFFPMREVNGFMWGVRMEMEASTPEYGTIAIVAIPAARLGYEWLDGGDVDPDITKLMASALEAQLNRVERAEIYRAMAACVSKLSGLPGLALASQFLDGFSLETLRAARDSLLAIQEGRASRE